MTPSLVQRCASWIVCIGFVVLGLLYLNGAIFSAWVAGGPPNSNSLGWERRALGELSFSLAAFVLAIGSYKLVTGLPVWRRNPVFVVAAGVALAFAPYVGRFIFQDQCLDMGGRWRNLELVCQMK